VKYSGKTLVAHKATAIKTTAATRIISGAAPSGGGRNHMTMLENAASVAMVGAKYEDCFSIQRNCATELAVSMRRLAATRLPRYGCDSREGK